MILLLKVTITILIVSALSVIAERISPRAAGILSGYPLGSAITLFFIGYEQGADFAGQSALFNVAGLAALLCFFFIYYHVSRRIDNKGMAIAAASLAGAGGFFALNGGLQLLQLSRVGCIAVGAAGIIGFGLLFRGIPDAPIHRRVRLGAGQVVFRAALAAAVILSITGAAFSLPPSWAGLFSAFPATVFPLVLILHATYGAGQAHTVIKNLPNGLWALVLYSLTISAAYPRLGIYWGTLSGFAVATIYLVAFALLDSRVQKAQQMVTPRGEVPLQSEVKNALAPDK